MSKRQLHSERLSMCNSDYRTSVHADHQIAIYVHMCFLQDIKWQAMGHLPCKVCKADGIIFQRCWETEAPNSATYTCIAAERLQVSTPGHATEDSSFFVVISFSSYWSKPDFKWKAPYSNRSCWRHLYSLCILPFLAPALLPLIIQFKPMSVLHE